MSCNFPTIAFPDPPDLLSAILALLPTPPDLPSISLPAITCPLT